MIDTKIRTLLTLVGVGSYTRAAEELHLTQPAVSNHIRQLEKEFAIKIFYPDKKELKITPEGEILVKYARRIMALYNTARQVIDDSRRQLTHLSIGMTRTAGENIMPQVIATYCAEHPGTQINIYTDSIKNLYERLRSFELDMAVVEGVLPDDEFQSVLLDTDFLSVIVSPKHRFAKRQSVSLQELKEENMILRSSSAGTRQLFDNYLYNQSENIKNFHVIMEVDNVAMIKDLVALNMGVSIIARSACRQEEAQGRLAVVPIENARMTRDIVMVYHKDFSHLDLLEELRRLYTRLSWPAGAAE